jgi:FAD/FMN-containing dehydrogenase
VVTALRFAREHDLPVTVRSGGHSFPGHAVCDDGLVVDLSPMRGVRVDPDARTVQVRAGTLLGELDAATQAHGLSVTCGIVTHTGVGGLTLGGGLGWTMRRFGLTVDHLLAVRLVTADGERVRAAPDENPDLFWGLRGGGGNFGVVTDFEFRLDAVGPTVVAGPVYWPVEDTPRVLRFYRDWVADCPDELMTIAVQRRLLDLPAVPRDLVGRHVVGVVACYAGPVDDGERVLRPLKAFGRALLDRCRPQPYVAHQASFDPGFPHGWWYYLRACDLAAISDEVVDVMADFGRRIVSPVSSVALWQMGGAVARVGADETPFGGRAAAFTLNINGNTRGADGFDAEREWARGYWSALAPHHAGVYVNFLMDEGESRVRQAYPPATYERLLALKEVWDPHNVFRHNQNVRPRTATQTATGP